jgi:hypothetical protein
MELKVSEIQELVPIDFNYLELKKELGDKLEIYKNIVYTEDTMKTAKEDRAKLNKLSKAINDKKIEIKKDVLKPFEDFETKAKELMGMIDTAVSNIDLQVKAFDQKKKDEKLQEIVTYFNENIGDFAELINFDLIFNERWLNATYSIKQIQEDINHIVTKTKQDLGVIDTQFKDEVINKQLKDFYFRNIISPSVLSLAIQEGVRIVENNKKLEELKQKQLEEKQQEPVFEQPAETEKPTSVNETKEELQQIDFRVWVTQEQKFYLREYLVKNNIKYGKVGN